MINSLDAIVALNVSMMLECLRCADHGSIYTFGEVDLYGRPMVTSFEMAECFMGAKRNHVDPDADFRELWALFLPRCLLQFFTVC
jgi:hypothetical protein